MGIISSVVQAAWHDRGQIVSWSHTAQGGELDMICDTKSDDMACVSLYGSMARMGTTARIPVIFCVLWGRRFSDEPFVYCRRESLG